MSHALSRHVPRVYADHRRPDGREYRRHFLELTERYGPLDGVARSFASGVARLWVGYLQDSAAVDAAVRAREVGTGRRPSVALIARLRKRQGLSWGSYDSGLKRLEELAGDRPRGTFADAVMRGRE
jgi:hypothetical protein